MFSNGKRFVLNVEGIFKYGVDACFVYDVRQKEINNLRWSPREFMEITIYELPHWVGDTTEYPPIDIP